MDTSRELKQWRYASINVELQPELTTSNSVFTTNCNRSLYNFYDPQPSFEHQSINEIIIWNQTEQKYHFIEVDFTSVCTIRWMSHSVIQTSAIVSNQITEMLVTVCMHEIFTKLFRCFFFDFHCSSFHKYHRWAQWRPLYL